MGLRGTATAIPHFYKSHFLASLSHECFQGSNNHEALFQMQICKMASRATKTDYFLWYSEEVKNLNKKSNSKRMLEGVVKWRNHASVLLDGSIKSHAGRAFSLGSCFMIIHNISGELSLICAFKILKWVQVKTFSVLSRFLPVSLIDLWHRVVQEYQSPGLCRRHTLKVRISRIYKAFFCSYTHYMNRNLSLFEMLIWKKYSTVISASTTWPEGEAGSVQYDTKTLKRHVHCSSPPSSPAARYNRLAWKETEFRCHHE